MAKKNSPKAGESGGPKAAERRGRGSAGAGQKAPHPSYDDTPVRRAEIDAMREVLTEVLTDVKQLRAESRRQVADVTEGPSANKLALADNLDHLTTADVVAEAYVNGATFKSWVDDEYPDRDGPIDPEDVVRWFAYTLLCRGVTTSEQMRSAILAKY